MKRCSFCGKEYPDDLTVCPIDWRPLVPAQKQRSSIPQPGTAPTSFIVKLVSPILSAGTYRVFVERNDLIFIRIQGGSKPILEAAAPLLGPFGALIPLAYRLFAGRRAKAERQRLEEGHPEDLLRENKNSFRLHQAEIREAAIEAPGIFSTSGKAGRLNLLVRHGEKIRCEFENANEMRRAIHLLVPLLNSTLEVNVKWNDDKQ